MLDATTFDEVTELVRAAGDRALDWFRRPIPIDAKPGDRGWDPVTDADRAVEAVLRSALTERFPDSRVIGEEAGSSGAGAHAWIIDPIDGTRSFVSGNPLWGTLVGLTDGDRARAGWMHLPALGETYLAGDGVDATLIERDGGRRRLRTRAATTALAEAVVACTHPAMFVEPAEVAAFAAVSERARILRFGGDCVNYGLVALGFVDAVIETSLADYDIAALVPIVEGAGGMITAPDGSTPLDGGFVVASAGPELHDDILAVVNDALGAG